MKSTKIMIAVLLVAVMAFGTFTAFAAEEALSNEMTDRFYLMEDQPYDDAFSMLNSDGDLVIHINDETPVTFEDGSDARERLEEAGDESLADLLEGRLLTITYGIVALSYPGQTWPTDIIIMDEDTVDPGTGDELPLNGEIVVNGVIIEASAPYLNGDVVMVPVRAIAEALGYDVHWIQETRGVRLGVATNLWIGQDRYEVARMAPITLGTAPELTEGRTYVPLSFFGNVVAGYAFVFEGQVVIGDGETDME
ncbi:MAG: copper amine oxidase N-terminal domain-containing protein [Clostridiales bacterium]|nr:copper amine oxidase N-terminal domain-containing protein [Clostridiales bacterium]